MPPAAGHWGLGRCGGEWVLQQCAVTERSDTSTPRGQMTPAAPTHRRDASQRHVKIVSCTSPNIVTSTGQATAGKVPEGLDMGRAGSGCLLSRHCRAVLGSWGK